MKSYNHLFEKLVSDENLEKAIDRSARGKTKRTAVKDVLNNKAKFIAKIRTALTNKTYKIKQHEVHLIMDGKPRLIIKPDYQTEQILHHAIVQIMSPIVLKSMYKYSCGSIPGKGAHYGKQYLEKYIREHKSEIKYVLKMDIHHFFQSIDTDILKKKFKELIHDEHMLYVLELVIDSRFSLYEGKVHDMGMPIGFYTSQWFANLFLQDLDHYIKEKLGAKCYVRYVDDMIIFHKNKKELHKMLNAIRDYLGTIGLDLKSTYQISRFDYKDKQGLRRGRPLDFIGFKFYRDRTVLRKRILKKLLRKVNKVQKQEALSPRNASAMLSYFGWLKHTNSYSLYANRIKPIVSIGQCRHTISKFNKEKNNGHHMEKCRKYRSAA